MAFTANSLFAVCPPPSACLPSAFSLVLSLSLSLHLHLSLAHSLPVTTPLCSACTILEVKELQEELALARRSVPGEAADAAELALMLKARQGMLELASKTE